MTVGRKRKEINIRINGKAKQVEDFKYLNSVLQAERGQDTEINYIIRNEV